MIATLCSLVLGNFWTLPALEVTPTSVPLQSTDPILEDLGPYRQFRYHALWDLDLVVVASCGEDSGVFLDIRLDGESMWIRDEEGLGGPEGVGQITLKRGDNVRIRVGSCDPDDLAEIELRLEEAPEWIPPQSRVTIPPPTPSKVDVLLTQASGAQRLGNVKACTRALQQASSLMQTSGRQIEDYHRAVSLNQLASGIGRPEIGLPVLLAVEPTLEEHLGPFHPMMLAFNNLIAEGLFLTELLDEAALRYTTSIEAFRRLSHEQETEQQAKLGLASVLEREGRYQEARALLEEIVDYYEARDSAYPLIPCRAKSILAGLLLKDGTDHRALAMARSAFESLEPQFPVGHPLLEGSRVQFAVALAEAGLDLEALAVMEEALSRLSLFPEDHAVVRIARCNLAMICARIGKLDRAKQIFESLLSRLAINAVGLEANLLPFYLGYGAVLLQKGHVEEALEVHEHLFRKVTENFERTHPTYDRVRQNYAITLYRAGRGKLALDLQRQGLEHAEAHGSSQRLFEARFNLSATLASMGHIEEAKALCLQCLESARTHRGRSRWMPMLAMNLSNMLRDSGDAKTSRVWQQWALRELEKTLPSRNPDLLLARGNYAEALKRDGQYEEARGIEEQVLEDLLNALSTDDPRLALAQSRLAVTYYRLGALDDALDLMERSLIALDKTHDSEHPKVLRARLNLAGILRELGREAEAVVIYEEALARWSSRSDHETEMLDTRHNLCATLARLNRHERFFEEFDRLSRAILVRLQRATTASLNEMDAVAQRIDQSLSLGLSLALSDKATSEGFESRLFVLSEHVRSLAITSRRSLDRHRERTRALDRAEKRWLNAITLGDDQARSQAWSELESVRTELAVSLSLDAVENGSTDYTEIVATLPRGSAGISLLRFQRRQFHNGLTDVTPAYAAFVVDAKRTLTLLDLGSASSIEALIEAWRDKLIPPTTDGREIGSTSALQVPQGSPPAGSLGDRVLIPLLDAAQPADHWVVAPGGAFQLVPLDSLMVEGTYLGDRVQIETRPCLRLVATSPPGEAPPSLLVLGGAIYDEAKFLKGTATEVEDVGRLFVETHDNATPPTILLGDRATKSEVLAEIETKRFVHLATHSELEDDRAKRPSLDMEPDDLFQDEQERVAWLAPWRQVKLLLAGSQALDAEELSHLDLSGCELLVLSACDTRLGRHRAASQGLASLQQAALYAGAQCVLASLWPVSDEATTRLMREFYSRVWNQGLPMHVALWEAKKALNAQSDSSESDWAGWVLSGVGRSEVLRK